jgi:hypothetical protein
MPYEYAEERDTLVTNRPKWQTRIQYISCAKPQNFTVGMQQYVCVAEADRLQQAQ